MFVLIITDTAVWCIGNKHVLASRHVYIKITKLQRADFFPHVTSCPYDVNSLF